MAEGPPSLQVLVLQASQGFLGHVSSLKTYVGAQCVKVTLTLTRTRVTGARKKKHSLHKTRQPFWSMTQESQTNPTLEERLQTLIHFPPGLCSA